MRRVSTTISVPLPTWLYDILRKAFTRGSAGAGSGPNLLGDRDIEWSWVAAHIPGTKGTALDFGPGGSYLGLIAAHRGYKVTALDLEPPQWPYIHPRLGQQHGDILKTDFRKNHFDLILNCSTVEHVGLSGRYGVTSDNPDGDLTAMGRLRDLLKPSGRMILTIPVGSDGVFPPLARVYGSQRLPLLLKGYKILTEVYWTKNNENKWVQSEKRHALAAQAFAGSWNPLKNYYGIGCFVLQRSKGK